MLSLNSVLGNSDPTHLNIMSYTKYYIIHSPPLERTLIRSPALRDEDG